MTAQEKQINLLPKDRWESGAVGKLLKWALNVGRYVVVFTELVVISAFLYRFSLDRKLTDLNEEMKLQQAAVQSYENFEEKFRKLQLQLKIVKEEEENSINVDEILTKISLMTPVDTAYKSITIREAGVSLEGEILSEVGLATLLYKAQLDEKFEEVILDSVSSASDKSQAIEFRMSLNLPSSSVEKIK